MYRTHEGKGSGQGKHLDVETLRLKREISAAKNFILLCSSLRFDAALLSEPVLKRQKAFSFFFFLFFKGILLNQCEAVKSPVWFALPWYIVLEPAYLPLLLFLFFRAPVKKWKVLAAYKLISNVMSCLRLKWKETSCSFARARLNEFVKNFMIIHSIIPQTFKWWRRHWG